MRFEACGDEEGEFQILRDGREVIRVPVATAHEGATVCEFTRRDGSLSRQAAVELVRRHLLADFLGGSYDESIIELVDLDEQCWARGPLRAPFESLPWKPVTEGLPPNIATRKTALARPPQPEALTLLRAVEGFRSPWTAACVSPDRTAVATAHGKTGTVWITRLADGTVERLPPCGAPIFGLAWGAALVAVEVKVPHIHVFEEGRWSQQDLGTGAKLRVDWSPDGAELAIACLDGHLRVFSWATRRARLDLLPTGEALYDVRYSPDGQQLFVGHAKPRITVHRASDGAVLREVRGTQHFQSRYCVGPGGALASSLFMKIISVFDGDGTLEGTIPNPAAFGLTWGGFARDGLVLVTECNEGWVKVYRRADRALLGAHVTKKEPIVVLSDAVVLRNAANKTLEVRALPE